MGLVRVALSEDGKTAAIVEVNSETDFVAKNDEFIGFVEGLAKLALEAETNDIEAFKAMPFEGATAGEALTAKIAKIVSRKRPRYHYIISTLEQRLSVTLKAILPPSWFAKILASYYHL